MKFFFVAITIILLTAPQAFADKIVGDYPICQSERGVQDYSSALMFSDFKKINEILSTGDCVIVPADTIARVVENTVTPKVLVFIPFKTPITGWTDKRNLY